MLDLTERLKYNNSPYTHINDYTVHIYKSVLGSFIKKKQKTNPPTSFCKSNLKRLTFSI